MRVTAINKTRTTLNGVVGVQASAASAATLHKDASLDCDHTQKYLWEFFPTSSYTVHLPITGVSVDRPYTIASAPLR